jgi:hypothetical protein
MDKVPVAGADARVTEKAECGRQLAVVEGNPSDRAKQSHTADIKPKRWEDSENAAEVERTKTYCAVFPFFKKKKCGDDVAADKEKGLDAVFSGTKAYADEELVEQNKSVFSYRCRYDIREAAENAVITEVDKMLQQYPDASHASPGV